MDVGSGKPRADRLIDVPSGSSGQLASWMADPPAELATVEPSQGELAPPGKATRQHRVDIPAEPGSDR
jgi:hypothetical protein